MPPVTRVPAPHLGPEDAVITEDGTVYSALRNDGWLLRVRPGAEGAEKVANIGGRGLGCELMPDGRVLVCNADLGLQAVDPETGDVEALLPEIFGRTFGVCNNASIAPDGTIYLSESSSAYALEDFKKDIVEDTKSGRLMRWKPGQGEPEVLLDGLSFANGVVLDPQGAFVLVAETTHCRIHRVWLEDLRTDIFAEVPGYPDNLSLGSDGLIWTALPAPQNAAVSKLHNSPLWLRKIVARLPAALQPNPPKVSWLMAFSRDGELVHFLEGDPEQYHHITGVREKDGRVWLGSIEEHALGYFDLA
ncbi:SMP-30/gluconolactonase/LRE family protein [Parvularcula mediterranea]|uniref:SMP-30/gluconolactonase/LRE family protein n=1 Tax=Parvularcula mediterranea TaxID=2732508 RepID=UPI00156631D3|nr:SMP-30/gluconolactonase/LRE family protein [Parvularcula mediterranea]